MEEYMYLDINGFPMKADFDTMKLVAVLQKDENGSVIEREPTEDENEMFTRDIFWSGSLIGRQTAEKLACDRNLIY